ncbi:hypothetical protein OH768_51530 [Streptomyces sp. NBC_01622]|uniref:hypothetical protein n=1 Tax=Streptomyces sp. NBC_01622 TaxID=2975903 RepID=UPI00386DB4CA|nr:hypothetical protein OH768_51530 [Streptomyces sp. NBC_01622]
MSSFTDPRRRGIIGPVLTVVAAGTALVLLASCGDGGKGTRDEGVASIATPSATPSATVGKTADPDAGHVRNPRYGDGVRAMVKCMNGHGIKSVVSDGNWGLVSGDSMNLPDFDKYRVECRVKSFGGDG